MISNVSNRPSFKSAHLKYTPTHINLGKTKPIDVPEGPVYEKFQAVLQGPQCNWDSCIGKFTDKIEQQSSNKPVFKLTEGSDSLITGKFKNEEYTIINDNKARQSDFKKMLTVLKERLKK